MCRPCISIFFILIVIYIPTIDIDTLLKKQQQQKTMCIIIEGRGGRADAALLGQIGNISIDITVVAIGIHVYVFDNTKLCSI